MPKFIPKITIVLPAGKGLNTQIPILLRSELPQSPRRNLNLSLAIDRTSHQEPSSNRVSLALPNRIFQLNQILFTP